MRGFAVRRGVKTGPLFRRTNKQGKFEKIRVSDLDSLFHDILRKVQRAHHNLIEPEVDVAEDFSVRRSLRRGGTSQARNQGVPEDVINTNNRWRSKEKAQARASKGSLLETYTDVLANLPLRLRFSQPFINFRVTSYFESYVVPSSVLHLRSAFSVLRTTAHASTTEAGKAPPSTLGLLSLSYETVHLGLNVVAFSGRFDLVVPGVTGRLIALLNVRGRLPVELCTLPSEVDLHLVGAAGHV